MIFNEVAAGDYFIGGRPLKFGQIFVHGHIRAGRTAEQKRQLLDDIVKVIADAATTECRHVWAYVSELPPSQMVEYGKVLPEPGMESHWLESMSVADREFVLGIGQRGNARRMALETPIITSIYAIRASKGMSRLPHVDCTPIDD